MNTCPYVIEPYSTNVCQLHILMERFSLEQPIPDGDTLECGDHLAVSELKICGDNHNQHIYVPFNGIDHIQLEFFLPNRWASTIWRLILTQLECPAVKTKRTSLSVSNSLLPFLGQNGLSDIRNIFSTHNSDLDVLAPPGCLQYHTARDGIIESFNYRNFAGPYLAGMTYAICFKRLFQDSMIQFTTTNFQLSKQITSDDGFDEQCHSPVNTQNRKSDYLMIPQAMFAPLTDIQPTYFCGASIPPNQIICSATPGPFIVYFSSDRLYDVIENAERGFRFTYRIQ